jgi:hypothetical protein
MSLYQPTTPDRDTSAEPLAAQGALRRFFAGWRRLEAAMDYGPFDYTNDRLRGLEVRIEQLEQQLAAAVFNSDNNPAISIEIPSDHG